MSEPTTILRPTNLAGTNPPASKVAKDALRAALEAGRGSEINGVNWNEVNAKSFVEKISAVFSKKAAAGNEQTYVDQLKAERTSTEQKPQESGVSYENNLKPSYVAQVQNTQKTAERSI